MARKSKAKTEREFLDLAMKRLKRCVEADRHNRESGMQDLKFALGQDQWDEGERKKRERRGRPALQINLLPKFIKQVTGEMRQNRPRVKVQPADHKANPKVAEIRAGIIADIEYASNALAIYDYAGKMQVTGGLGGWVIKTRQTNDNPFLKEIFMERLKNPFLAYLDPDCKDESGADARYGFVLAKMSREDFDAAWPKAAPPGDDLSLDRGLSLELWYDDDTVTVADYYVRETEKVEMALLSDGNILPVEDAQALIDAMSELEPEPAPPVVPPGAGDVPLPGPPPTVAAVEPPPPPAKNVPSILKTEEVERYSIKYYTITASEILTDNGIKGEDFPGEFVPIILAKGEETVVEGKTYRESLITQAKDPQKLVNYWETSAAEVVALAPKNPWVGTAKMFEGYEADYAQANTDNLPFLKYNIDPDSPDAKPTRQGMGDIPIAIFTQRDKAHENIKNVLGMFNADLGEMGPERSQVAILERQKPGDIGTFCFLDNLSRAVAHSGRVINSMIPEVYDSERDVGVREVDGTSKFAVANARAGDALEKLRGNPQRYAAMNEAELKKQIAESQFGPDAVVNDLTAGRYEVEITVKPSYSTQRTEAAKEIGQIIQSDPSLMKVFGDIYIRHRDFLGAEEAAKRFEKIMPQGLVEPKEGDPPPKPQPPTPQEQKAMLELQIKMKELDLQGQKLETEKIKTINELQDTKGALKSTILEILAELHAPIHKADGMMPKL